MSSYIETFLKEDADTTSEETSLDDNLLLNEFNTIFNTDSDLSKQTQELFKVEPTEVKQKKPTISNIFTEVDVTSPGTPFVKTIKDIENRPYTTPEGLTLKSYNKLDRKNITKESLLKDASFLSDARTLLKARHNIDDDELDTPDKIWEAWTERQRYYDTGNEFTLARDFDYLYDSDDNDVKNSRVNRYGRLLDVWEKYKGEDLSFRKVKDYMGATFTSPSNIFSAMLATKGKLGTGVMSQSSKQGIKTYIKEFLKGAAKVAPVEFGVGYLQSSGKEKLRSMTMKEEYRPGVVGLETGIQGAGGSLFGGFSSLLETRSTAKAIELKEAFKLSKEEVKKSAKLKTDEFLKTVGLEDIQRISKKLERLNPELTAKGRELRKDLTADPKNFIAGLPVEFHNNLVAATLRMEKLIKLGPTERVTAGLHRAITEGVLQKDGTRKLLETAEIKKILRDHNLTTDQFGMVFLSDVSDAARILQSKGQLSKALTDFKQPKKLIKKFGKKSKEKIQFDELLNKVDALNEANLTGGITKDVADNVAKENNKGISLLRNFFKNADRAKLGMMTSQPQTTIRNNINGLFRVGVDTGVYALNQALQLKNPFSKDTLAMAKYMVRPAEARIFRDILKEDFPEEMSNLFREAADLNNRMADDGAVTKFTTSKMAWLGTKMNYFNTLSDNYFKQAALTTFLRRGINNLDPENAVKMTTLDLETLLAQKIQKDFPNMEATREFISTLSPAGFEQALKDNKIGNLVKGERVHDFFTLTQTGKLSEIPDEVLKTAIQDTYEFVYQATFKSDGYLNRFNKMLQSGHKNLPFVISTFLPFPRYTANHLKTIYNHVPLINMVKIENIGSRKLTKEGYTTVGKLFKTDKATFSKDLARGTMGTGLFLAALEWRYRQGNTNHWWEIKSETGKPIDGRPIYGALAPWILAADIMYRYQTDTLPSDTGLGYEQYSKDASQALIGVTVRRGMGLLFLEDFVSTFSENKEKMDRPMIDEFIGNVGQAFMIPTQIVKNFYGISDKDMRKVPESKTGQTNILDTILASALRGAPDFKSVDVKGAVQEFEFFGEGKLRADKLFTNIPTVDKQAVDPRQGPRRTVSPIYKLSGFTLGEAKTIFDNELTILNIPDREFYKRDYKNPQIEVSARDLLGKDGSEFNLAKRMATYIRGKPYQTIIKDAKEVAEKRGEKLVAESFFGQTAPVQVAPAQRTTAIMKIARLYVQEARAYAASKLETIEVEAGFPYTSKVVKDWRSLSGQKTVAANEHYRQTNDFVYDKNKNLIEPKNIYMDRNYFIVKGPLTDKSWANRENVFVKYTDYAKGLGKKDRLK